VSVEHGLGLHRLLGCARVTSHDHLLQCSALFSLATALLQPASAALGVAGCRH
jgi:hypothetical protein